MAGCGICGLDDCSSRELDRRLRAAMAFLQQTDFEIGRILRQVVERKLYRELGFESFERYVQERLDLSPRTARRLVRLARAEHGAPAVASAFRAGRITLLQAEVLLCGEKPEALEMALRVGSARRGGRMWRGTALRYVRITTIAGCTPET